MSNESSKPCSARQRNDQMHCGKCGLTWDMNDEDPPACNPAKNINNAIAEDWLAKIKASLNAKGYN